MLSLPCGYNQIIINVYTTILKKIIQNIELKPINNINNIILWCEHCMELNNKLTNVV